MGLTVHPANRCTAGDRRPDRERISAPRTSRGSTPRPTQAEGPPTVHRGLTAVPSLTRYKQSWGPGPAVRPPGQTPQPGSCAAGAGSSAMSHERRCVCPFASGFIVPHRGSPGLLCPPVTTEGTDGSGRWDKIQILRRGFLRSAGSTPPLLELCLKAGGVTAPYSSGDSTLNPLALLPVAGRASLCTVCYSCFHIIQLPGRRFRSCGT